MGAKIFFTTPNDSRTLNPVPSTGNFGSAVNLTSSASNANEASTKVKIQQTKGKVPQGTFDIRQKVDSNGVPYFVAELQRGGKRRKSRKPKGSRRHKKSRRHRKSRRI